MIDSGLFSLFFAVFKILLMVVAGRYLILSDTTMFKWSKICFLASIFCQVQESFVKAEQYLLCLCYEIPVFWPEYSYGDFRERQWFSAYHSFSRALHHLISLVSGVLRLQGNILSAFSSLQSRKLPVVHYQRNESLLVSSLCASLWYSYAVNLPMASAAQQNPHPKAVYKMFCFRKHV